MGKGKALEKDCWDKLEIVGKFVGAILIPLAIGGATFVINSENSKRDTSAQMASIAVSILSEKPDSDLEGSDPLREWAITVLEQPGEVIPLNAAAAQDLRSRSLNLSGLNGLFGKGGNLGIFSGPPVVQEPYRPGEDRVLEEGFPRRGSE